MHIVIGYKSNSSEVGAEPLYCGSDKEDALKVLNKSEFPFVRKEIYSNAKPNQRKFHDVKAPVKKAAKKASKK